MRVTSKRIMAGSFMGKPLIHIIILLDKSGSMDEGRNQLEGSKYNNAIIGINEELNALKADTTATYLVTIIEFDSDYAGTAIKTIYDKIPLESIIAFSGSSPRGSTPLYEAVGITLLKYMRFVGEEKTLVKVFTDGGENQSLGIWSKYQGGGKLLADTIAVAESKGFTVTFVGTQLDVDNMVTSAGLRTGNTMAYDGTARGMKMSMVHSTGDTIKYASKVAAGEEVTDNFYSKRVVEEEKN